MGDAINTKYIEKITFLRLYDKLFNTGDDDDDKKLILQSNYN